MASHKKKRNHESDSEPDSSEPSQRVCHWVKFFEIVSTDESKPVSKVSPFVIEKTMQSLVGTVKSIKKLRKGSLLVEVASQAQSKNIVKMDKLANSPVLVSPHKSLNSSKGVIRTRDLDDIPEADILNALEDQNVTSVKRVSIKKGDNIITTGTYILTFGVPELPSSLKLGYLRVKVDTFIPNPLRCFQCQKFGHGQLSCRGSITCFRCGESGHNGRDCEEGPKCRNCQGAHMASSKECPIWKTEKQIQQTKVVNKITYAEAKKIVEAGNPTRPTYARTLISTKSTACAVKQPKEVTSRAAQTDYTWPNGNKIMALLPTQSHTKRLQNGTDSAAQTRSDSWDQAFVKPGQPIRSRSRSTERQAKTNKNETSKKQRPSDAKEHPKWVEAICQPSHKTTEQTQHKTTEETKRIQQKLTEETKGKQKLIEETKRKQKSTEETKEKQEKPTEAKEKQERKKKEKEKIKQQSSRLQKGSLNPIAIYNRFGALDSGEEDQMEVCIPDSQPSPPEASETNRKKLNSPKL